MLQDARQWLNSGRIEDTRQARSGATALHVAAAKGYSEVLRCGICQRGGRGRMAWVAGLQGCQPHSVLCVILHCGFRLLCLWRAPLLPPVGFLLTHVLWHRVHATPLQPPP